MYHSYYYCCCCWFIYLDICLDCATRKEYSHATVEECSQYVCLILYAAVWVLQLTSQSKKQKSTKSCAIINIIPNTGAGFEDHVDHVPFFQFKNKCIGQADITSVVVHVVALGNSLAVVIQQNAQHLWDTCVPPVESEVVHPSERGGEYTCAKGETQCTSLNWNTLL